MRHQTSNTVCPGDMGQQGGGGEGEDGYSKVGQWSRQQGRASLTQSGVMSVLMCERIVLVLRQTDLGAKPPITCCSSRNTNPAAAVYNPSIHSGGIYSETC